MIQIMKKRQKYLNEVHNHENYKAEGTPKSSLDNTNPTNTLTRFVKVSQIP